MERHVQHSAEPRRQYLRQRSNRRWIEHAGANHPQTSGTLGDEHVAVWKKRETPGMVETFRQHGDMKAIGASHEIPRALAERVPRCRSTSAAASVLRWLLRAGASRTRLLS